MSIPHGSFVWYDALVHDLKAAEVFYKGVIGWQMADAGFPDRSYTLLSVGPEMVGGLMPIPDESRNAGVAPCWTGYISVEDVDFYAGRVKSAGGTVFRAPEDIPGVGRFSVVADPHGAVFILFKTANSGNPSNAPAGTPGHIGWHELYAGDVAVDLAFYSALFGWTKGETIEMGPMGVYQIFAIGGVPAGGIMNRPAQMPKSFWLYYFNVEAIDAAMARVKEGGGKVMHGPQDVPGGNWIAHCMDPQGAMFGMLSTKR